MPHLSLPNPSLEKSPTFPTAVRYRKANNNIFVDDVRDEDKRVIPNPVCTFEECFLHHPGIMDNIKRVGFAKPTPIQVLGGWKEPAVSEFFKVFPSNPNGVSAWQGLTHFFFYKTYFHKTETNGSLQNKN